MPKSSDKNQREIVAALRDVGAFVTDLHMVGKGCPDILVGFRGAWYLQEIKVPVIGKLTDAEMLWWAKAKRMADIDSDGVVFSVEESLRHIGAM